MSEAELPSDYPDLLSKISNIANHLNFLLYSMKDKWQEILPCHLIKEK